MNRAKLAGGRRIRQNKRKSKSVVNSESQENYLRSVEILNNKILDMKDNDYIKNLRESVKNEGFELIKISASIEEQISQMEEEDQNIFLNEYGLKESGLNKLIKASYSLLGLITFFTAGPKHLRELGKYILILKEGLLKQK